MSEYLVGSPENGYFMTFLWDIYYSHTLIHTYIHIYTSGKKRVASELHKRIPNV